MDLSTREQCATADKKVILPYPPQSEVTVVPDERVHGNDHMVILYHWEQHFVALGCEQVQSFKKTIHFLFFTQQSAETNIIH